MKLKALQKLLLQKSGSGEEYPFGPDVMVFKVSGKVFAITDWTQSPLRISLKCDPFFAEILREKYKAVIPGYHLNKKHWNTVILDGSVPESDLNIMIDESYELVVKGLPKKEQKRLNND